MNRMSKQPRCKVCKQRFLRPEDRPNAITCSPDCAIDYALQIRLKIINSRQKKERQQDRERKEKLKTLNDYKKELEAVVNKYVRLRDRSLGCVSCDKPSTWQGQWHASHFRSVAAASAIRFNLWNIHKACSICNNWKSGNLSEYEPRLREKIGDEKVDWLRSQNQLADYSIEYLVRFKKIMLRKIKRIERKNHAHDS